MATRASKVGGMRHRAARLALVALAATGGVTLASPPPRLPPNLVQLGAVAGPVYRVSGSSFGVDRWTEFVAPRSGHCRREAGFGRIEITGGRTRAVLDPRSGVSVRTGSTPFLGTLMAACGSLAPLRDQLARGEPIAVGTSVVLGPQMGGSVEEELTVERARETGVFSVPLARVTSYTIERRAGERPWQAIRAYWLGRSFSRWRAVTAAESFVEASVYGVFYELPAARGRSSAQPGQPRPRGEIQVVSQPRRQVRRTVLEVQSAQRRHRWPRWQIRLANRERATVYPNLGEGRRPVVGFVVVTRTTVVSFSGSFQLRAIPALARRLRPVAAK